MKAHLELVIAADGGKPLVPFARSAIGKASLERIHPENLLQQTLLRATCILLLLAKDRGENGVVKGKLPFQKYAKGRTWIRTLGNSAQTPELLKNFFSCFAIGQFWTSSRRAKRSPACVSLDLEILPLDQITLLSRSTEGPRCPLIGDQLRDLARLLESQFLVGKTFEGKYLDPEGRIGWKTSIVGDLLLETDELNALKPKSEVQKLAAVLPFINTRPRELWSLAEMTLEFLIQFFHGNSEVCIGLFEDMTRIRPNICNEYLTEEFDFPLLLALSFDDTTLAKYLLSLKRIDLKKFNKWGTTPFLAAARINSRSLTESLLRRGDKEVAKACNFMGGNAIHEAAFGVTIESIDLIKQFIELGINPSACSREGLLPLSVAICRRAPFEVITSLINFTRMAGMLNVRDGDGETLVYKAFKHGDFPTMIELACLMREGDDWMRFPITKHSELFDAAHRGHISGILRAIVMKCRVDARETVFRRTALHEAVEFARPSAIQVLLSYGADPFLRDNHGRMPREFLSGDDRLTRAELEAGEKAWLRKVFNADSVQRIAAFINGGGSDTLDRETLMIKSAFVR